MIKWVVVFFVACRPFTASAPEGFAAFKGHEPFRAVSPESILYRVHREANEPRADLGFWQEAMKRRMLDAGYHLQSEAEVADRRSTKGHVLELTAPVGQEDEAYLIALFVSGKDLLIAEASGEVTRFAKRRDAVLAAVARIDF